MFFIINFFEKVFSDPVFAVTAGCAVALIGSALLAFTVKPRHSLLSPLPELMEEQTREIEEIIRTPDER